MLIKNPKGSESYPQYYKYMTALTFRHRTASGKQGISLHRFLLMNGPCGAGQSSTKPHKGL